MACLCAPQPPLAQLPIFFDVEGVVGAAPAQNLQEDVIFVQFAFETIGKNPVSTTKPEYLAACQKVKVTGRIDDATIHAIRMLQEKQISAAVVDGRISPARGGYSYGADAYTIVSLNNSLQNRNLDIWPRIDRLPGCPAAVTKLVHRTVRGT